MRVFFAIEFNEGLKESLLNVQEKVRGIARGNFTVKDNFHLTIKFIGDADNHDILLLKQAAVETSYRFNCFQIKLNQTGTFDRGNKKIVWASLKESRELLKLYHLLEKNLEKQGFHRDKRLLTPHITIGREVFCRNDDLKNIRMENAAMTVSKLSLMESRFVNYKLNYVAVETFDFLPDVRG